MPSPQVCYVAGCKNLAAERCADCAKPVCGEHAWWNPRAQPDTGDIDRRCPDCYLDFMDRRFKEVSEELRAARAELVKARAEDKPQSEGEVG